MICAIDIKILHSSLFTHIKSLHPTAAAIGMEGNNYFRI